MKNNTGMSRKVDELGRIVIPKIKLQLIFSFWKCNIAKMGKERTKVIMKAFSATNQVSYI